MTGEPFGANLFWVLSALLLVLALIADGWSLVPGSPRRNMLAAGAVAGAAVALIVVLLAIAANRGLGWQSPPAVQPLDAQQVLLGLALAMLLIRLGLAWRLQVNLASLVVSLLALAGILVAGFSTKGSELPLACGQSAIPLQLQWVLFLIGAAGLAVAGSTALALALRAALAPRTPKLQWPRWIDLHALLKRASELALVALGAGLATGYWWLWGVQGASAHGQPGEDWIMVALLVTAMSYLTRRAGGRWGRWTAGLVMAAAVIAILGLLAGVGPLHDLRA